MFNKEYNEESGMNCCEGDHMHHWPKKMKKEFKMAMLRKKEKMLEAKLAFVREMKDLVEKMPEEMKEKEEKE